MREDPKQVKECFRWGASAWLWVVVVGLGMTLLPRIHWHGKKIRTEPSLYASMNVADRVTRAFSHWDANHYIRIATLGYRQAGEGRDYIYAFFPGWPGLLALGRLLGLGAQGLVLWGMALNLFFWALALWAWREVLGEIPTFTHDRNRSGFRRRFTWLFCFYPTALFCVVPYPEAAFLAMGGLSLRSVLKGNEDMKWLWGLLPCLMVTKHVGIILGTVVLLFGLLFRHKPLLPLVGGWALGLLGILGFYALIANDPFIWFSAQHNWGRALSWPHEIFFDTTGGRALELPLYVALAFIGPLALIWRSYRRAFWTPSGELLMILYLLGLFVPVWFGGNNMSIYRIVYLAPFVLGWIVLFFSGARPVSWRAFQGVVLLLNIHAVYRFVAGLRLP